MRERWPLTGRTAEMAFIAGAVGRSRATSSVVLAGAAGVGKTRLAQEALAVLARGGVDPHWVVGTASARAIPLGAFVGVLGVLPGVRGFQDVIDVLTTRSGSRRSVIGIDDAHLLDEVSAHVVHQLVLRTDARVVITVRTGEPAPDAVTAVWKDGYAERLEIQPLAEAECRVLLETVLGGPIDTVAAHQLWRLTGGNVLYLRHLVVSETVAGRLRQSGSVWRWSGETALPAPLVELLDAQMGEMSDEVCFAVDLVALGEPLDLVALARLARREAIESAEKGGLITVEEVAGRLEARLTHPLYGEARRERLGGVRGRRLRAEVAGALADESDRPEVALRRAMLALEAGLDADHSDLTAAAQTAMMLGDLALAERLSERAIGAGAGFDARLVHAYAAGFQGRGQEAEEEFIRLERSVTDDIGRVLVGNVRAGNLFWTLRQPERAEAVLAEHVHQIADSDQIAAAWAVQASFHSLLGRCEHALSLARAALRSQSLPDQSVIMTAYALVVALGVTGRGTSELDEAAERGYVAGRSFETSFMRHGLVQLHLLVLRLAGRIEEAQKLATRVQAEMFDAGHPLYAAVVSGYGALAAGRLRTAIRWQREAQAGLRGVETHGHGYLSQLWLTQALALAGEAVEARAALSALEAESHPSFAVVEPDVLLARSWVAGAEGASSEAIRWAHDAAWMAADRGHAAYEVFALHAAVCLGDRTVSERLVELAGSVEGPRAPIAAAHAVALATDDGDRLRSVSEQLAELGDMIAAADAAAQAAEAHRRAGRRGSAAAAAARAHQLATRCEGARTPAVRAAAQPLPLTAREREIVVLAARGGSTSRQIAERLGVSVRTVEGHLYRAHAKLGTTSRAQFAALLADDALILEHD